MPSESANQNPDQAPHLSREDGADLIVSALHHLRRSLETNGETHWKTAAPRQERCLQKWAEDHGLLIEPGGFIDQFQRGGQEHDIFVSETTDRYFKLTRDGVFGFSPGIDLALVASGEDGRRFHLWEASPYLYLERLFLQNTFLTPRLNRLEGVVINHETTAVLTSQPRLELNPVTQDEIDAWFASLGFKNITNAAYYRPEDNLGIFDAHDKNVVRFDTETLIPFDVIPCHPEKGFLDFIESTLTSGHTLTAVRSTS